MQLQAHPLCFWPHSLLFVNYYSEADNNHSIILDKATACHWTAMMDGSAEYRHA